MPSDPRVELALRALAGPIERYRSAVAAAGEEVRGFLAAHRSAADAADAAVELGPFAAGRIDVQRFSRLLASSPALDAAALSEAEAALGVLRKAAARGAEAFHVRVEPGGRLRDRVEAARAEAGRVVEAARRVARAKSGAARPAGENGRRGRPLAFAEWTEGERRWTPPLVVELEGADLRAAELGELLDGGAKIVLVVRGECAPAPLVRLITPGTLVLQTADETGLDRIADAEGPAVAALVPEGAARFLHDPAAGAEPWARLTIWGLPDGPPKRPVGGLSVRQQAEELEQLRALAARPTGAELEAAAAAGGAPAAAARAEDPVDRLAAWLLSQADLKDLG